jgi:hypothetical protein
MSIQSEINWKKVKKGIGWSRCSWSQPLRLFFKKSKKPLRVNNSLEIGAGEYGTMAGLLDEVSNNIKIGYYKCDINALNLKLKTLNINHKCDYVDINQIDGKYDLIILKSVLGGVFLKDSPSGLEGMNQLIQRIIKDSLNEGGILLTIDNGKSFFEGALNKAGLRKYDWRYFNESDFVDYHEQYSFGFLSCFSFETRIGVIGRWIDNIACSLDMILTRFTNSPTVILTIFKN